MWSGVNKYNLDTNIWTVLAAMKEPRTSLSCILFDSTSNGQQVMVAGGLTGNWEQTSTAEVYSVTSNEWSSMAPVPSNMQLMQISGSKSLAVFAFQDDLLYQYNATEDVWVGFHVTVGMDNLENRSNILLVSEDELDNSIQCT